ncbi:MAG TPA: hypothetical protein PK425_02180 [Syntrophales bacterium]|jgi:VIT1/CCC1 family predicted Fe2+/Mn2+ transporter|nr:hypothetical protein [Syntrophales bacterium]HQA82177.1 hypothetical protein [Syntrophales bacterium]
METFFFIHMTLMSLGFLLLAGGVITVRYLKKKMGWFRLHKRQEVLSAIFFVAGAVAAVLMVELSGGGHLSVPHTWLGAVLIVLMAATLVVGFLQARVKNKKRMRMIHRVMGRTAAVLSLAAVATGAVTAGMIPFF